MKLTVADRRKDIQEIRPAMAYAYYFRGVSKKAIAKKFNCSEAAVTNAIGMYGKRDVEGLYGKNETVLIIPIKHMKEALSMLKEINIPYRLPSKEFVLEEYYESNQLQISKL